ncbi:hypothetical protein [Litoribrevibacter albus]|uniref:DUF1254 domain-containing protein n=1 Tax=Litoribrevibacter albus TaxID=1473156 RepID=A0AA37W6G2_9GAMM|nr:hypothetical protein [Litoribrevibacter albus]GLQ31947.1 hypothetical protein GCM10007876_24260 [Litoribrevibacter albus]
MSIRKTYFVPLIPKYFSLSVLAFCSVAASCVVSTAQAVEGYPDYFLDREQTIFIHGVVCGDFKNPRSLKPSGVYTNSKTIETGTYYFGSKYGNYSYTFAPLEGQPDYVMKRGLLTNGVTDKTKMKIDLCIVKDVNSLPAQTRRNLTVTKLMPDDPAWDKTMDQYAVITGRPAFGENQYENPRAVAGNLSHDQQVYDSNQAFLSAAQVYFDSESQRIAKELPKQLAQAIRYAHQEDGFIKNKTYPVVEKPLVWTPTSEKRYNDQLHRVNTEKAFDQVIQQNFDWLFGIVGKGNSVTETSVVTEQPSRWDGQKLIKPVTAMATFENGKSLLLDFVITSENLDVELFDSLEQIQDKSNRERNSMIVRTKKDRELVKIADAKSLDVYSPVEEVHLFFSPFRTKSLGDGYRYQ